LTEESNDAKLIKKIENAKRKDSILSKISAAGILLLILGLGEFFVPLFVNMLSAQFLKVYAVSFYIMLVGLLMLLIGILLTAVGLPLSIHQSNLIKKYYREFTVLPKELKASYVCPNCKRDMPKEYADICIF
jgi:hypothetical protein